MSTSYGWPIDSVSFSDAMKVSDGGTGNTIDNIDHPGRLLDALANCPGGSIVCSGDLTREEIQLAQKENRWYVNINYIGFALIPPRNIEYEIRLASQEDKHGS